MSDLQTQIDNILTDLWTATKAIIPDCTVYYGIDGDAIEQNFTDERVYIFIAQELETNDENIYSQLYKQNITLSYYKPTSADVIDGSKQNALDRLSATNTIRSIIQKYIENDLTEINTADAYLFPDEIEFTSQFTQNGYLCATADFPVGIEIQK